MIDFVLDVSNAAGAHSRSIKSRSATYQRALVVLCAQSVCMSPERSTSHWFLSQVLGQESFPSAAEAFQYIC